MYQASTTVSATSKSVTRHPRLHCPRVGSILAFLSFGTQHHDIALCQAPAGAERGVLGINHIAMQIEGGAEELGQLYGRLLKAGASIDRTTEHSTTLSVYFFDPDGNRLEIFAEKLSPEEGRRVLREGGGVNKPLALEPILA